MAKVEGSSPFIRLSERQLSQVICRLLISGGSSGQRI